MGLGPSVAHRNSKNSKIHGAVICEMCFSNSKEVEVVEENEKGWRVVLYKCTFI